MTPYDHVAYDHDGNLDSPCCCNPRTMQVVKWEEIVGQCAGVMEQGCYKQVLLSMGLPWEMEGTAGRR